MKARRMWKAFGDLMDMQAASIVNIKLMKCGIADALEIAALCKTQGIGLMIGGMVESILAMTVSACFASGLGGFCFVDLDTPLFMTDSPLHGGMVYEGGRLNLSSIQSGHGVVPIAGEPIDSFAHAPSDKLFNNLPDNFSSEQENEHEKEF